MEHAAHAYFFFTPGIPWQDSDVTMSTKVGLFLHALDVLEEEVEEEAQLSLFYLGMAAMQLFRLLYATKAHPRIAILVKTLIVGLDDLAHFSILFVFLIGGYMALGHSQFGGSRPEFEVCVCVYGRMYVYTYMHVCASTPAHSFAQNLPRLLLSTRAARTEARSRFEPACNHLSKRPPFEACDAFDPFLFFFFRRTSKHPSELCGK